MSPVSVRSLCPDDYLPSVYGSPPGRIVSVPIADMRDRPFVIVHSRLRCSIAYCFPCLLPLSSLGTVFSSLSPAKTLVVSFLYCEPLSAFVSYCSLSLLSLIRFLHSLSNILIFLSLDSGLEDDATPVPP